MAIEETTRLGLPTYTSGSDFHPQRSDFNTRMELLDQLAAIVEQGPHEDRPLPETMGRLWMSTDTEDLFYDTGTTWVRVVRIGAGGAGEDVVVDGTASEGSSNRAARADHTHNLPLATPSSPGAMSAPDKAMLDSATYGVSKDTLMMRDSDGGSFVWNVAVGGWAVANREFVEAAIDDATSDVVHAQNATNGAHLDDITDFGDYYTSNPEVVTPSQGYPLDGGRGVLTVRPMSSTSVGWVVQVWLEASTGRTWSRAYTDTWSSWVELATTSTATSSDDGLMSAADKDKLDQADYVGNPDQVVKLDSDGGHRVRSVGLSDWSVVNKGYVEDAISAATSSSAVVVFHADLTSSDHLDNVTTPGEYMVPNDGTVSFDNGYPYNDFGGHVSVRDGGSRIFQEFTVYRNTPRKWMRVYVASVGTWGDWVEFATA